MEKMTGKILNTQVIGLSTEQVLQIYKKHLLLCDDFTLTVATVPKWAYNEIQLITGIDMEKLNGYITDYDIPRTTIDVRLKNEYKYPRLYNAIMNDEYFDVFANKKY